MERNITSEAALLPKAQPKIFCSYEIKKLEGYWTKCFETQEHYANKQDLAECCAVIFLI
jgi:hypothetical protein